MDGSSFDNSYTPETTAVTAPSSEKKKKKKSTLAASIAAAMDMPLPDTGSTRVNSLRESHSGRQNNCFVGCARKVDSCDFVFLPTGPRRGR